MCSMKCGQSIMRPHDCDLRAALAAACRCYDNRMDSLAALRSKRFVAAVNPVLGGTLAYFGSADDPAIEFVRPTPVRAFVEHNVRATAGYPLVPYSNRIGDGRFAFDGTDYALAINSPIPWHPIHGLGWIREWTVAKASPEKLELALRHAARGASDHAWPWSFDATQTYELDDERMLWGISVTNRDSRPMPAGIGMHPFFPKTPAAELQFAAGSVWRNDERMLPVERTAVPAEWDFAARRRIGELAVDNCFAKWSGEAVIAWPDRGWTLRIAADPVFGHLVVFTSPARDSIAIVPISHANNAVNLASSTVDTGLRVLAPGETLSGAFTMTPATNGEQK
jgi:aldose 1-epimerase